jgi:hypothetical protein
MAPTHPAAYAFDSPLTLDAMHAALQAAGPWKWERRESDTYGDYVGAWPDEGPSKVRIFQDKDGSFLMDVLFVSRSARNRLSRDEIEDVLQNQVLPALQAANVRAAAGL